jgi:hypothetical protein
LSQIAGGQQSLREVRVVQRKSVGIGGPAAICFAGLFAFIVAAVPSRSAAAQPVAPTQGRLLVDAIGTDNIMSFPMHQQMLVFMRPLQEANKARQQEVFEIFDKIVMPQAMLAFTAAPVKDQIAKYYEQNFSQSELQELTAFFSTPVGKKFASKSSSLSDGLPQLAVRLLATATVQGGLSGGMKEIEKRGMVIPKPPTP